MKENTSCQSVKSRSSGLHRIYVSIIIINDKIYSYDRLLTVGSSIMEDESAVRKGCNLCRAFDLPPYLHLVHMEFK